MIRSLRYLGFACALLLGLGASHPAAADWHGHGGFHHYGHSHSRVFLGFGFGPFFPFYDPYYYPPAYAYYPPAYYAPPVYAAPAPQVATANCMRFNGDATNDQSGEPFYGTACLQADGRWHIVSD